MSRHAGVTQLSRFRIEPEAQAGQGFARCCHGCHTFSAPPLIGDALRTILVQADHPLGAVSKANGLGILSVGSIDKRFLRQSSWEAA